jgi:Ca2+-binding EF-hand superfamily protein
MGLDKFKIHPSKESSFYEWVSYTPTSYTSSIGRKMNIGSKRPSNIPIELINEFEKKGWGKISFKEFLKDKNV